MTSYTYPLSLGNFSILVDICNAFQRPPDFRKQRFGDFVLGAVNLPTAHIAELVLGPQKVVVGQTPIIVQIYVQGKINSVRIGFGPAMKMGSSRPLKRYPTTYM